MDCGLNLKKLFIKERWFSFFPLLYHILVHFETFSDVDAKARVEEQRNGRGLRLFTMVPLIRKKKNYILIDSNSLVEIYSMALSKDLFVTPKGFPRDCTNTNRLMHFKSEFRKKQLWEWTVNLKHCKTKWDFDLSISTDGVTVAVHFKKTFTSSTTDDKGYKKNNLDSYVPLGLADRDTVVGLDPGRDFLFVCNDGSKKKIRCSTKEWRVKSGCAYQSLKQNTHVKNSGIIGNEDADTLSPKVATTAAFTLYLDAFLENYKELVSCYGSLKWRQLRRKTDIKRQKAYNVMCKRIAGVNMNAIVAYGAGGFSSTSPGHASAPIKGLYKALLLRGFKVLLVDEHRTSKVCSKCLNDLPNGKRWQVRICKSCRIHWNRDMNAARNIRQVFIHIEQNKGERPIQFKTKKQQNSQESGLIPE